MNEVFKNAIGKINANEKSLNMYIDILKRKINNATENIKKDEENIKHIQENMEKAKATLEEDKFLLEGLEAVISLSKNY